MLVTTTTILAPAIATRGVDSCSLPRFFVSCFCPKFVSGFGRYRNVVGSLRANAVVSPGVRTSRTMSDRSKRKASDFNADDIKRSRADTQDIVEYNDGSDGSGALIISEGGVRRTSTLLGPTMLLQGHRAAVHSIKFNPDGNTLATASFDKTINLWNVRGENENYMMLEGHKNAVLDIDYSPDGLVLASCSADTVVGLWDVEIGKRIRTWRGHTNHVNAVSVSENGGEEGHLVATGSNDGTTKLWDSRSRKCCQTLPWKFQILSVAFNRQGDQVFSGSLDNTIQCWDLRKGKVHLALKGHRDSVTGLRLSPDGNFLLSNAADNSLKMWDVRPFFAGEDRCVRTFKGHRHTMEKMLLRCAWSADGKMVTGGSGDSFVYVWNAATAELTYKLPGHSGSVNEVSFHPSEPIIGSASSDKTVYLGEL